MPDPPHAQVEPALRRRGGFFLDGGWDPDTGAIVGPAWVQWEAPAEPADWLAPVVLVHGGGGQATDWMWAVEGQPGWADHFVEAGHPTYLVDRTGHGRSVWDPRTLGLMHTLYGNPGRTESMCFSPDSKTMATGFGGTDFTIRLWDISKIEH